MTADHAAKLLATQERLERAGWVFDVSWLLGIQRWNVTAWHRVTYASQPFMRDDRTDALSQALQWAACENEEIHAA